MSVSTKGTKNILDGHIPEDKTDKTRFIIILQTILKSNNKRSTNKEQNKLLL